MHRNNLKPVVLLLLLHFKNTVANVQQRFISGQLFTSRTPCMNHSSLLSTRREVINVVSAVSSLASLRGLMPEVLAVDVPIPDVTVNLRGSPIKVGKMLGSRATLVVNVASYCALTPQYKDLVSLWDSFHNDGLQILAFPCNQFGQQEPEADVEVIRKDMLSRYNVQFPILDKIDVNGANTHLLYQAMKSYEPELSGYGSKVNWNFEKFLLDSSGTPVRRYRPGVLVTDSSVVEDVETLIKKGHLSPRKKTSSVNNY